MQDSVESVLIKAGYDEIAKAYILYRKQREKLRNIGETLLDYKKVVDNYLKINDWRVKENSTVTYSVGGLILSNSGAITANYWLTEVYDEEIAEAQFITKRTVRFHISNLLRKTGNKTQIAMIAHFHQTADNGVQSETEEKKSGVV